MTSTIELPNKLIAEAKIMSQAFNRSVEGQIEYWAKIGKIVEANPSLTFNRVREILIAQEETKAGTIEPCQFEH